MNEIVSAAIEAAGVLKGLDLLKEVYVDVAQPGARQVGIAVGTLLELTFSPLNSFNERRKVKLGAALEELAHKLRAIPEGDIVEVSPEIGVPAIERLTYVSDSVLRALYLELLAAAASKHTVNTAHPNFLNIIQGLSPDEANLVGLIGEGGLHAIVERPAVRYAPDGEAFRGNAVCYIANRYAAHLQFPENMNGYLSNLLGLGILEIWDRQQGSMADIKEISKTVRERSPAPESGSAYGGLIALSAFGMMFLRACVPNYRKAPFSV